MTPTDNVTTGHASDEIARSGETGPALRPIAECALTEAERFGAVFSKGWIAIDTVTGACLHASRGRTKRGDTRYTLIVPTESVEERGGLFAPYDWTEKDRKFIRAWSLREAVEVANLHLRKILAARATGENK